MLCKLILNDFRNYHHAEMDFDSSRNVFIGQNGQGKTNLLEAIFFLSMLRSFRTSQIRDLKRIGAGGFYIGGEVKTDKSWSTLLEVEYLQKRRLKIDSNPVGKASDFIQQIHTVAFSPDDIYIVNNSSSYRRRFIDMFISTINSRYLNALQNYHTALSNRNILLKKRHQDNTLYTVYERLMAENGAYIVKERHYIIGRLTEAISQLVNSIKEEKTTFQIRYRFSQETDDKEAFFDRLQRERTKEMEKGWTTFGIQLDDLDLMYNDKLLRTFGSTGQCRLIALCLKMAKLSLLNAEENAHNHIIALVDDVTGELDLETKTAFYSIIKQAEQTFFTFTELPHEDFFEEVSVFRIENGEITK